MNWKGVVNVKNVIIYRDHLLPSSETFIREQGENLSHFTPFYVGSRSVPGLMLPPNRSLTINKQTAIGWMKESVFKISGISPELVNGIRQVKPAPALLHAHFGFGGTMALPLVQKLKLPLIVTFHGIDATTSDLYAKKSFFTHRQYIKKRKQLKERASLFIAVSDFIKTKLINQGYEESKIIRHYIGIDVEKFAPNKEVKRKNIVLFVGRLVEVKGCKFLINAVEIMQKMGCDISLVVIGDGPLRDELESMADGSIVNYRFLGVQPPEKVKEWMNVAKVLCVPSVVEKTGQAEAFGMVFIEASAMGLPVVSFRSGGIPEAVSNGQTGFLVPEKDSAALAVSMRRLFEDDILWNKFSKHGMERVRKLFNIKDQSKKLEEIYDSIIIY